MKKVLGLDIGVSSIGLAVVRYIDEQPNIEELSVRIIPEDPNFHGKFYSGNTASKNLDRTVKRGIRRNNQRFKLRRDKLKSILIKHGIYPTPEMINWDSVTLYRCRAKAASEQIGLKELGRVLIHLNQRRGFLSNRKSQDEVSADTDFKQRMAKLEEAIGNKTIGQKLYEELQSVQFPHQIVLRERTYLRSSYLEEFDRIWDMQKAYYPELLTGGAQEDQNKGTLYDLIRNKTIFYQRPLKSQKGLISKCPFEKNHRAAPKSSPYFQLFRIWQRLNDLNWKLSDGTVVTPTDEQKQKLLDALVHGKGGKTERPNKNYILKVSAIKKLLGFKRTDKIYLNFTELEAASTHLKIKAALEEAVVDNPEQFLHFDLKKHDEKGGLFELWHLTYSIPMRHDLVRALTNRFPFTQTQASIIAQSVHYKPEYGRLSTRAIRKLLPHLINGLQYSDACDKVGYDHSGYKTEIPLRTSLKHIPPNYLRNPVVEQVLNQVVNMVNLAIEKHGAFDEIRVELARELRNSAKSRKRISQKIARNKKSNEQVRERLQTEYNFKLVNGRDIKRFHLWEETDHVCLYCGTMIGAAQFKSGEAEIEHILPRSRSFDNSMNNYILAHRKCNDEKGQRTAYDYMISKGDDSLSSYLERVNRLYKDGEGSISERKFENLLCSGDDIPSDFVERMKKDSQYIALETVKMLKSVCKNTYTTTGQVTDFLREKWELKHVLQELMLPIYEQLGQVQTRNIKTSGGEIKQIPDIENWSKRDDHRHHAVDALICALTDQKLIFKLNNLNKLYQWKRDALTHEEKESIRKEMEGEFNLKTFGEMEKISFEPPCDNLRQEVKKHLESILISFKKSNSKVLTKNINQPKNAKPQTTWVPRAPLHEETVMGKVRRIAEKPMKLNSRYNTSAEIAHPELSNLVAAHLTKYANNPKKAFSKATLRESPIRYKGKDITTVPVWEEVNTKRVALNDSFTPAQVKKIADARIRKIVEERIERFGNIKKAFSEGARSESPVWLNEQKGIQVKTITVYDDSKVEKLRDGYVKTGGNHHALIFIDEDGNYNEKVISNWEAVEIGLRNIDATGRPYPIIRRENDPELGRYVFSLQINDLFIMDLKHNLRPAEENELNFLDPVNRSLLSKRLFRLQKMSKSSSGQFISEYRHHLESTSTRNHSTLKGVCWERISKNSDLSRLTKVQINHLGRIVAINELKV